MTEDTPVNPYPFRIFLSYAHADIELVHQIAQVLDKLKHEPLWDRDIHPGIPFTEAIKALIERSHLFIPVITKNSQKRPWVHQETGYAIALNIPVLPLAIGKLPKEMIESFQAVSIEPDLSDLETKLQAINFSNLVFPKPIKSPGIFRVAEHPETRTALLLEYTDWVAQLKTGNHSHIRHQGILSSFSIPEGESSESVFRFADRDALHLLLRKERQVLETYAKQAGCTLIIDPDAPIFEEEHQTRAARLRVLLQFFAAMPKDKLRVVISPQARQQNSIIVGDYFFAESMAARVGGYYQTVFNAHPPTVLQRVMQFDLVFNALYRDYNFQKPQESVDAATAKIEEILVRLSAY